MSDGVWGKRLGRDDFGAFFAALHDGAAPFDWQWRLLDSVLDDCWPDALAAPTGSGKTSVIDVHVFALAVAQVSGQGLPRRRLAMVVNRRVLVDDQYRHARVLADRLARPDDSPIVAAVAEALWQVQGRTGPPSDADGDASRSPLMVARLRGGEPPSRRWADHPTAAAVICATPDMWGSRLLFRGYGSSSKAWPREAGLLAFDTVAVVDEAHLARQLVRTARRVGQLATVADRAWYGPSPLHVVEATATRDTDAGESLGVEDADLDTSTTLRDRLRKPKPVRVVPCVGWPARRDRVAVELARQVVDILQDQQGTVGCFVNTVAQATAVAEQLRGQATAEDAGRPLTVVMICGQVRPIDVELLTCRYPGLLDLQGNPDVNVIVSTQSLEVGVDIDLAGIVTELASGSALAQRAGRVNRRGLRTTGPVVVIGPDGELKNDARSGPYEVDELREAAAWLRLREADPNGLSPWAMRADPAPSAHPARRLLQRLELGQAWHWARTSDDLAAEPELELWLSDDLSPETSVGIVTRADLPEGNEGVELIKLLPPRRHEVFAVSLTVAKQALSSLHQSHKERDAPPDVHAVVVRGDDTQPLDWTADNRQPQPRIRPGDIIVVDADTPIFTRYERKGHISPPVVAAGQGVDTCGAEDVLEALAEVRAELRPGEVVHRIGLTDRPDLRDSLSLEYLEPDDPTISPADQQREITQGERNVVTTWLKEYASGGMSQAAAELLLAEERMVDIVVQRDDDGSAVRVLVIDGRRAVADEYIRQEWTPSTRRVLLDSHQADVADRVTELARLLRLPDDMTAMLRQAAAHHDDGKADPRFQIRLGARPDNQREPLAKSRSAVTPQTARRRQDASGLPPGWRHEQRSVIDAWAAIPSDVDRELVARLIGTTHGHGRTGFPHVAAELLNESDDEDLRALAAGLFDEGGWDQLIEHTHLRYGVWACAYLEAVLRAADGRISAEGR